MLRLTLAKVDRTKASQRLQEAVRYLDSIQTKRKSVENTLDGAVFCFTGAMRQTRGTILMRLTRIGGREHSQSVTYDVTHLVAADVNSRSTKARKAREYGIPIMSEDDFFKLLEMAEELQQQN